MKRELESGAYTQKTLKLSLTGIMSIFSSAFLFNIISILLSGNNIQQQKYVRIPDLSHNVSNYAPNFEIVGISVCSSVCLFVAFLVC